jgi:lysyl-tRNA synthetase class 2
VSGARSAPGGLAAARSRAQSLQDIRDFFRARGVLEVETPLLSRGVSLDCHIDVFAVPYYHAGYPRARGAGTPSADGAPAADGTFYLQTSPEPHMKRLLCRGFPDIFQITKAFRNGETGRLHNPEFTMLEWYRRGFSLAMLMDEVAEICALVVKACGGGQLPVLRKTYRQVFQEALGVDPLEVSAADIAALPPVAAKLPEGHVFSSKADALDFAMAHAVEPGFPRNAFLMVHDFPSEQAAQARVLPEDPRLAHRFEVYGGAGQGPVMELGNGYLELQDAAEYARRFDGENLKRRAAGKPELPPDPALLAALEAGLPDCAGVAMGLDRLLMLGLGSGDIGNVLGFPWGEC